MDYHDRRQRGACSLQLMPKGFYHLVDIASIRR